MVTWVPVNQRPTDLLVVEDLGGDVGGDHGVGAGVQQARNEWLLRRRSRQPEHHKCSRLRSH